MPNPDARLIQKAAQGHQKSQHKLYLKYYGYCLSVAMRYSSSREEAKDLVHDAYVKAFSRLEQFDLEQPFKGWIRRIVINVAIDHYRKASRESASLEVVNEPVVPEAENTIEQLAAEEILALVAKLSPSYRIVFTLYVVEGYKHEEIAKELGISAGTSKSNLAKARAKLQRMILAINPNANKRYGS